MNIHEGKGLKPLTTDCCIFQGSDMRTMEGKRVTVGMILRLITTDVGLNK